MDSFIRFMAPVVQQSATALMRVLDKKITARASHLHLMISSPGGSVFHGLSIHNFLRGAPIPVTTYNFGSVDSIGVVIFCAGTHRVCVPHARFLIHGVSFNVPGPCTFDEKGLEERLKLLKIDYQNIARVIGDTTSRKIQQIVRDMNNRTTLTPEQAKAYGLVHEIKPQLFPLDADLTVIHEDGSIQDVIPAPFQPPLPVQHTTQSLIQAHSDMVGFSNGTYFPSPFLP